MTNSFQFRSLAVRSITVLSEGGFPTLPPRFTSVKKTQINASA